MNISTDQLRSDISLVIFIYFIFLWKYCLKNYLKVQEEYSHDGLAFY